MDEQYEPGWRDPRKMSRRELEDWTDRNIPEWTDWRPKLMVPRWVIIVMYGALVITFTFAFVA